MYDCVLKKIKPNSVERKFVELRVKRFLSILNKNLKNAETIVGGSFAKNTWLKGNHDIDIFVLYKTNENISQKLGTVLKECFKNVNIVHGSRDYFQIKKWRLDFEVIPVFKISKSEDAKNVTDVSILHANWVIANSNERLVDEIRLAKQFCKTNRIYGAETFIKGFSGYVLEILVIYYDGFEELIKAACKWKKGDIIDIMNYKTNLNKDKLSPLIVIDPVQKERNAAAALSFEKLELFINLCKKYVKKRSIDYFVKAKVDLKKHDIVLQFKPLIGFKDVVGTKALKVFEFLNEKLDIDFGVKDSGWYYDEQLMYFDLKKKKIDPYFKHFGPLVNDKINALKFKQKHSKVYVFKGRLCTNVERTYKNYLDYVKSLLSLEYVQSRLKSINRKIYK